MEELEAAASFFSSCCFLAVPGAHRVLAFRARAARAHRWRVAPGALAAAAAAPGATAGSCRPLQARATGGPPAPRSPHGAAPTLLPCTRTAEAERGSAAKWAVLQALLARGLRQQGGATYRQLPVLLTHVGDELLQVGGPCCVWRCSAVLLCSPLCWCVPAATQLPVLPTDVWGFDPLLIVVILSPFMFFQSNCSTAAAALQWK